MGIRPIASMYGIFTYSWSIFDVGKCTSPMDASWEMVFFIVIERPTIHGLVTVGFREGILKTRTPTRCNIVFLHHKGVS